MQRVRTDIGEGTLPGEKGKESPRQCREVASDGFLLNTCLLVAGTFFY